MRSLSNLIWMTIIFFLISGVLLGSVSGLVHKHSLETNDNVTTTFTNHMGHSLQATQFSSKKDKLFEHTFDWPLHDDSLTLKMTHVRYMDKIKGNGRSRDISIAAAFYYNADGHDFKFNFIIKKQKSNSEEWMEVGRGHIAGIVDFHKEMYNIKECISNIKGIFMNSSFVNGNNKSSLDQGYFKIQINYADYKDEFRYNSSMMTRSHNFTTRNSP